MRSVRCLRLLRLVNGSCRATSLPVIGEFFKEELRGISSNVSRDLFLRPFIFTFKTTFLLPQFVAFLFEFVLDRVFFSCILRDGRWVLEDYLRL